MQLGSAAPTEKDHDFDYTNIICTDFQRENATWEWRKDSVTEAEQGKNWGPCVGFLNTMSSSWPQAVPEEGWMKGLGNCSLLAHPSCCKASHTPTNAWAGRDISPARTSECESALVETSYKHPPQGLPVSLWEALASTNCQRESMICFSVGLRHICPADMLSHQPLPGTLPGYAVRACSWYSLHHPAWVNLLHLSAFQQPWALQISNCT